MNIQSRRLVLAVRPTGIAGPEHFEMVEENLAVPRDGQVLLATRYLSIDPAMRVWISEQPGYVEPVAIGATMRGGGIAEVVESCSPGFQAGDMVQARVGWQSHAVMDAANVQAIDTTIGEPLDWIGPLGLTGLTAYFGLLRIGDLKPGETVLVSAASGAVGQMVGQIAKLHGAYTIGIAGGPEKCQIARDEHGFDEVIDYQSATSLAEAISRDVDVYFDNVGGAMLEAALARLATQGRVVICGRISQTASKEPFGITNTGMLIGKRGRMQGFIVSDFAAEYAPARQWIAEKMRSGQLRQRLHIVDGLDQCPHALAMLFRSQNHGKLIVRL